MCHLIVYMYIAAVRISQEMTERERERERDRERQRERQRDRERQRERELAVRPEAGIRGRHCLYSSWLS